MHRPTLLKNTLFKSKRQTLITASALALFLSAPALAFNLGKALEEAAKKELDKSNTTTQTAPPTEATPANTAANTAMPNAATPNTSNLSSINWKKPSTEEEIRLGREITGNLLGAAPLVKDEGLQTYVNKIGRWVASQSERPDLPWRFGVIESNDINAFAAPGGYVLITKGLYQRLQNEAQLAAVLGHEVGHVVKKHQLKIIQKQQLLNLGAGFLSKKLAKDNQLTQKIIGSGAEISARKMDKTAEFEADNVGMVLSARAGYDAYGLVDVLQIIGQTNKNDSSVALLFSTHPSPDERLTSIANSATGEFDKLTGKTLENRLYKLN